MGPAYCAGTLGSSAVGIRQLSPSRISPVASAEVELRGRPRME